MREIDIYDLFEALHLPVHRADDVFEMQQGDIYLIGTISGMLGKTDEDEVDPYAVQALFRRTHGALSFEAFSTLFRQGDRATHISAQGRLKLSVKKGEIWLEPAHQSALDALVRIADMLLTLGALLSDEQKTQFTEHGLQPLYAGLWLDRHLQTVEAIPMVTQNDDVSIAHIDFNQTPILLSEQIVNEFKPYSINALKARLAGTLH